MPPTIPPTDHHVFADPAYRTEACRVAAARARARGLFAHEPEPRRTELIEARTRACVGAELRKTARQLARDN